MRLGIFLCTCGKTSNIDFKDVKKGISSLGVVEIHDELCQGEGLAYIVDDVRRKELDTVVIGCTVKNQVFEGLIEKWELKSDLFFLNLREYCGWVHGKKEATEKAKLLLQVGIQRLENVPILPTFKVNVGKNVLVSGKSPVLEKLSEELSKVSEVTYISNKMGEVKSLWGHLGNFSVVIDGNPIDQEKCISCGKCIPKCPESAIVFEEIYYINEKCNECGKCLKVCPTDAIDLQAPNKILEAGQIILDDPQFSGKLGIHIVKDEKEALAVLSQVISNLGEIHRNRYLKVNLDQCAAGKSETIGCQICESVCPHGAIVREKDRVLFDEISCMGCGLCTSSCPNTLPQLREYSNELLYSQLETLLNGKLKPKIIMFTCDCSEKILYETGRKRMDYPPVLPFSVPCLSTISESHMLKALELGADGVLLLKGNCSHDTEKFSAVEFAKLFQNAFDLGRRIKMIEVDNPQDFVEEVKNFASALTPFNLKGKPSEIGRDKRSDLIYLIKNFIEMTGIPSNSSIRDPMFPFARIEIDREKCTTCDTCMNMCPTEAIKKIDNNKISFVYPYCIACGLCQESCPEGAITIEQILDFSQLGNDKREIIMQSELMKCKNCAKPFTTVNLYKRTFSMIEETGGAGEFDLKEQRELMQFCEDCRPIMALEIYQRKDYGDTKSS